MAIEIAGVALETLLAFIGLTIGTVVVSRTAYTVLRHYLDVHTRQSNSKVIARAIQYVILAFGLYIGLVIVLRLDLGAVAASLGIITLIVAFSGQQIISNTLAGVMLILRRPYHIDDWIQLSDPALYKVKDISLTNTFLLGMDGTVVTISNGNILSSKIVNYSRSCFIQIPTKIDVPTSSDFAKVTAEIMAVLEKNPKVLPSVPEEERSVIDAILASPTNRAVTECDGDLRKFEPRILITKVTPTTISLEVRLWIRNIQEKDLILSEIMTALLDHLRPVEVATTPPPSPDSPRKEIAHLQEQVDELQQKLEELQRVEPLARTR